MPGLLVVVAEGGVAVSVGVMVVGECNQTLIDEVLWKTNQNNSSNNGHCNNNSNSKDMYAYIYSALQLLAAWHHGWRLAELPAAMPRSDVC